MRKLILTAILGVTVYQSATRAEDSPAPLVGEQATTTAPQMIAVDVKLIEISRTKMRDLGVDVAKVDGNEVRTLDGPAIFDQTQSTDMLGFVDALIRNKIAFVLANPKVATIEGNEASLSIGSQVERTTAGNTHYVQRGTRLSVVPKLLANESVQLEFLLEWSGHSPSDSESKEKNNTRNFEIRTSTVTPLGQSTLLTRSIEMARGNDDTIMLLVVTPELVKATANANRSTAK